MITDEAIERGAAALAMNAGHASVITEHDRIDAKAVLLAAGYMSLEHKGETWRVLCGILANEIGRQVSLEGARPEDWLSESFIHRIVTEKAQEVLIKVVL